MSETYKKLIKTLRSIFEMDKADLDFGIYRIMNQKRDDFNQFLENDLLPQVKQAFSDYENSGASNLKQELETAIEQAKQFGAPDPENAPAVLDIKKRMSTVDATSLENDVFSKLHTFLSRYYDKGDFISQRRYKDGTYAIPYKGEEVKLYWANHDQYYIKSSEHLRDYAFIAKDKDNNDKPFRIKLVEADTEKDNVKAKSGEERRFVIDEETPLSVEDGQLLIHFNFLPVGKKKQEALNKQAVEIIFNQTDEEFEHWLNILRVLSPTEANKKRTVLEKHLNDYTARNTFDYFIHKDLGGFLNRELDFYIKNEVLFLDDIDDKSFEVTEQQLRKIKVLRSIAQKIIRMLEQLEDFQKKMWLKKKIVIETNYCMTLDRVPTGLLDEVLCNSDQKHEWVNLFSIDKVKLEELYLAEGFEGIISRDEYRYLLLDTKHFSLNFKDILVSSIEDIDAQCDGVLINSDNFQGLSLLENKYNKSLDSIYLDPPYNTSASEILYKNNYKHSSWLSLMNDRLLKCKTLLKEDVGFLCCTIDDVEQKILAQLIENVFGELAGTVSIRIKPSGRPIPNGFALSHEYAMFARVNDSNPIKRLEHSEEQIARYRERDGKGRFFWEMFRKAGSNSNRENRPTMFYPFYVDKISLEVRLPAGKYNEETQEYILLDEASETECIVYPIKDDDTEGCWYFGYERARTVSDEFKAIKQDDNTYRIYYRRRPNEGVQPTSLWSESKYSATEHGTALLKDLFGKQEVFSYPKSIHAVYDCLSVMGINRSSDSTVLDCFAGSGTTGHAVLNMNRIDNGKRKYVLIDMAEYFEPILLPRIKKSVYSSSWSAGVPCIDENQKGLSQTLKYMRLEGYEDTLNNLNPVGVKKSLSNQQQSFLDESPAAREDYNLGYWLDVETENSPSLLNIEQFEDPFNYQLNIGSGSVGATKPTTVDLVETFNYLLGLTVKSVDVIRGFKVVIGTNTKEEPVLVVWRNLSEKDNAALDEFLDKQGYNPRDTEFSRIYVNGDHTLEDPYSKVKMTEIEFKRLMFDTTSV